MFLTSKFLAHVSRSPGTFHRNLARCQHLMAWTK